MAADTTAIPPRHGAARATLLSASFYILLILGTIIFIGPLLWALLTSFKPESELYGSLFPTHLTLDAYSSSIAVIGYVGRAFFNSFFDYGVVTVIALVFSSMAGYALARLNFVGRGFLFNLILFTMTIPSMLTLVPLYIMVADFFGWSDNYLGIIAPSAISTLGIFWFRQFFLTLPQELFEAGRLDGLSDLGMLFGIAWPLSRGVVLMVGLLVFMQGWNDLLWPLMVEHAQDYQTASQVVALFVVGGQAGSHVTWQMAMAMVLGAPILIAYVFAQRHIVEGIATTGLK